MNLPEAGESRSGPALLNRRLRTLAAAALALTVLVLGDWWQQNREADQMVTILEKWDQASRQAPPFPVVLDSDNLDAWHRAARAQVRLARIYGASFADVSVLAWHVDLRRAKSSLVRDADLTAVFQSKMARASTRGQWNRAEMSRNVMSAQDTLTARRLKAALPLVPTRDLDDRLRKIDREFL